MQLQSQAPLYRRINSAKLSHFCYLTIKIQLCLLGRAWYGCESEYEEDAVSW